MRQRNSLYVALCCLASAVVLLAACSEEQILNNGKAKADMSFAVTDVQEAEEDLPKSRAYAASDYATHSIDFTEPAENACLQETTIEGVNPVKRNAATRAILESSINHDFGVFACKNGGNKPDFFYNEQVHSTGTMVNETSWAASVATTLKFYAIYPYLDNNNSNQKLVQASPGDMPYVDFTVSTNIANQTDLMRAVTNDIAHADDAGRTHVVPLKFHHTLTAIRFGVGSNLSWNKTIQSVEFKNINSNGHYDISTGTWSNQGVIQNYKLDGLSVSTSTAVNNVILKDGNTFLMIPQTLPSGAQIVITFSDNTQITAKIEGSKWKPGTTKTYMITERNSNWEYFIEATSPSDAIAYNESTTGAYTVKSYRKVGTEEVAVKWKVVGYSTDNGATWSDTKPAWLTNLSLTQGNGGTAAEVGVGTLRKDTADFLNLRNEALKKDAKGTPADYYDLSLYNVKGQRTGTRNTANCYIISHPGLYRLPLVYGNGVTANAINTRSYKPQSATGANVLTIFKDHLDNNITNPWIEKTNGAAYAPVDGAEVVWSDEPNLVRNPKITRQGGNAYLSFEVKHTDIKTGNAVVAVKKGTKVLWSWHLWFTADDVLETTTVTNPGGHSYKVTNETLGWKYTFWSGSTYHEPRSVQVKVEQEIKNGAPAVRKYAVFTLMQNDGVIRRGYATLYQFGRKDALPGTDKVTISYAEGLQTLGTVIQHPRTMYHKQYFPYDHFNVRYFNLWSAESTTDVYNDNVVYKTVYDPSPVGFKVPAPNLFTAFSTNGVIGGPMNIARPWNYGHTFYNKVTNPDATLYFPATGSLFYTNGVLREVGVAAT